MHLHTFSKAPNPKRLDYFLKFKGIKLPTTEVNIRVGEHFSDDFKAINQESTVPTLVLDDGIVLTDTVAICVYLEKLYPEKPLFGANASEYAQVIGWDHKLYVNGLQAIAEVLRNKSEAFKSRAVPGRINIEQLPALADRGLIRLAAFWQDMETHLTGRQYLVGKQLTLADIDLFVLCAFVSVISETVPQHCTALLQWHQKVASELAP